MKRRAMWTMLALCTGLLVYILARGRGQTSGTEIARSAPPLLPRHRGGHGLPAVVAPCRRLGWRLGGGIRAARIG